MLSSTSKVYEMTSLDRKKVAHQIMMMLLPILGGLTAFGLIALNVFQ